MTMMLTAVELSQLQRLATEEDQSAAHVLRSLLRKEYKRVFQDEPATTTPPTMRGLIDDLVGRAHLFVENIANRMGIPADDVMRACKRLEKKKLVVYASKTMGMTTYDAVTRDREEMYQLADDAKIDLDEPLAAGATSRRQTAC